MTGSTAVTTPAAATPVSSPGPRLHSVGILLSEPVLPHGSNLKLLLRFRLYGVGVPSVKMNAGWSGSKSVASVRTSGPSPALRPVCPVSASW